MNIPIFLASDNNYAPYLAVVIKSICENTKSNINFYILDKGIDNNSKKYIDEVISQYKNINIEYISIGNDNIFNDSVEYLHITKAAYLRLLIPELKPEIKKAIYLDTDIIVNTDIQDLYNEELNGYIIGAVYEEMQEKYHSLTSKKNLKINNNHKYFNSGVLLIDCEKWRENNINKEIENIYYKYKDRLFFLDQDILNVAFSTNNYKLLDKKYNYLTQNPVTQEKVNYHYDGNLKPWDISQDLKSNIINYIDNWWEYAEKTPCIDIIKNKCKYKDKISFRVARAKKAHDMLNATQIINMYNQRNKLVSVIIPVYNAEKYIEKCLNSITNQTYKELEIICINDVSKDSSLKILEEFRKKDTRIKVINNEKNKGAALTRNVGLDNANGEYIYFIDADDYIDDKYLENMVNAIENAGVDIALNINIQSECNSTISEFHHPSMPEISKNGEYFDRITTIHDAPCFIWARIYRKSFLDKYNLRFLDINATDDVVFNAITSMQCEKTYVFRGETYHYTVNEQSVTGNAKAEDNRDFQHIKAHYMIYNYLKEHNIYDKKLKLFRVYPFMTVNTKEKFDYYKMFFNTIENDYKINKTAYNDMEKYFVDSILNSSNYDEYLKNYNKIVTIGYLRRNKCKI